MQTLEGESTTGSAAALQGDEASAPAGAASVDKAQPKLKAGASAKAKDVAPTTLGNEAQPVATAQVTRRPAGAALAPNVRVKILPNARGPKQAPHVGKEGHIVRGINPQTWEVSIPREKRSVPWVVAFRVTELEVL